MSQIFYLYAEVSSQIPIRMPSALRNLVTCSACSGQIVRQKLRYSSHIFLHLTFTYHLLYHVFPTHGQLACIKRSRTLLTYCMVQSPSWEANWFPASHEIPRISRNPKVHYRTHKRPPPISILGPPNPVHIPTSHLLKNHPNIIHPSMPRPPQWSLSFRFPHQDPIHPPLLTHTRHMPSPSHSSRFYHPHNIGWGVQIT